MQKKFDFNDINLIPNKCIVTSRSECSTDIKFGNFTFKLPIIPANMSSVIDVTIAENLAVNGYFYIMHRFLTNGEQLQFIKNMNDKKLVTSISIGVKDVDYNFLGNVQKAGLKIDFITIDIAHGHAETVKSMIEIIKEDFPETFIIAGNVSTTCAVGDLQRWGANAIKVGIGPGKSCTTFYMTGFGSRNCQASTIMECAHRSDVPIIADGGIVHPADITKAIVLGATMVMCGGLITGCTDSPGESIIVDGIEVKEYWGSASEHQFGKSNRIEGKMSLIPLKNKTVLQQLTYLTECLQSSISYGGGNNLQSLNYVKYN
jgi:GMP reductase